MTAQLRLTNCSALGFVWLLGHIMAHKAVVVPNGAVCMVILKESAVTSVRRWHHHTLYTRFQPLLHYL